MSGNQIKFAVLIAALPFFFALSLAGWRVDNFLVFNSDDDLVFSAPAANGNRFITRYIHSVEQTPVEDEYCIIDGGIWIWEERVRSSGAGLPSVTPPKGRFIDSGEWLIYQGSRNPVSQYYYRVGDQYLGLNQADFVPFGRKNLYIIYSGERLRVSVEVKNLLFIKSYAAEELAQAPSNVSRVI